MADETIQATETVDEPLGEEDVRAVLGFDLDETPPETTDAETPSTEEQSSEPAADAAPVTETPTETQTAATAPESTPKTEPQGDPEKEQLKQLLETQKQLIAEMNQQRQVAQPPAEQQQPGDDLPSYDFDVPDEILQAMGSDDPKVQKAGVTALVKGVATAVHRNIRQEHSTFQREHLPAVVSTMMQQQAVSREVFSDFYGKYPDLNKPQLRVLVQRTGAEVMQARGARQWSAQLRDEIAGKVMEILRTGAPQAAAVPAAAKPPVMFGGSPRQPASTNNASDDVKDTLGL